MTYEVGETVVYPHHGAARIIDIRQRKVRGEEKTYLQLEVAQGDLTILVPAESVELIGVRDVVDETGLEKVFEVLRAPLTEEPTNWSRRFKANQEKIASGDVIKVAEVVRDLSRRDTDRGLSAGEKRMLAKARQILVSELALAQKTPEEEAESRLDEVLASNDIGPCVLGLFDLLACGEDKHPLGHSGAVGEDHRAADLLVRMARVDA